MADKENDEDKFEDDEDFGLPELHYEELDNDTESSSEEPEEDKPEEEKAEEAAPDPFGEESSSDSADDAFYEAESFDEFKEDASETTSVFDSDDSSSSEDSYQETSSESTFGSDAYSDAPEPEPFTAYYDEDTSKNAKSNFTKIVVIGTLLFASIAIVFVFVMDGGSILGFGGKKEVAPPPEPEPVEETPAVDSSAFQPVEPEPVKPQANQTTPGQVTTLAQRTGKSYVVIGSFFDGDLAMDYAKKLAENGNSPQIIPPFKDYRFYRVAIAEFETFKDAETQAPSYGEQFGREAWPLRY